MPLFYFASWQSSLCQIWDLHQQNSTKSCIKPEAWFHWINLKINRLHSLCWCELIPRKYCREESKSLGMISEEPACSKTSMVWMWRETCGEALMGILSTRIIFLFSSLQLNIRIFIEILLNLARTYFWTMLQALKEEPLAERPALRPIAKYFRTYFCYHCLLLMTSLNVLRT